MTHDEILWTSPYDDQPELPGGGDLIDMAHDRSESMAELPKVCELCGGPTPAAILTDEWYPHAQVVSKAKRCFVCWDLERDIKKRPEAARKILKNLEL